MTLYTVTYFSSVFVFRFSVVYEIVDGIIVSLSKHSLPNTNLHELVVDHFLLSR